MKRNYFVYLVYLIMLTLVVTGVSFSRYSTTITTATYVTVAKPVLEYKPVSATLNGEALTGLSEGIILEDILPGDQLVYNFEICNFEGAEPDIIINQVFMKYHISISFEPAETNLPLEYELIAKESYPSKEGWTYMGFESQITQSFTLTVTWDNAYADGIYKEQQQSVQIEILAEQTEDML